MITDVVPAEVLRIADRLERRSQMSNDADDVKAALLLRLLVAVWTTSGEPVEDAGISAGVRQSH